jgi:hypothetical protein
MIVAKLAVLLGLAGTIYAADPMAGVWKLNPNRSTGAIPAGELLVVRRRGSILQTEIEIKVSSTGAAPMRLSYSVPAKGGKGQVQEGRYNGVLARRMNGREMELTYLVDGKAIRSTRAVVSKDGRTITSTGRVLSGEAPAAWVMVFERQ